MVIDAAVKIPAIAIVTIQIPKFQVNTLDPSRLPIGSRLNTARKLLTEYPVAQMMNISNASLDVKRTGKLMWQSLKTLKPK